MYLLSSKDKICTIESSKRGVKSTLRRRVRWAKGEDPTKVSAKNYLQNLLALGLCLALFWSHMKMSMEKTPLDGKRKAAGQLSGQSVVSHLSA